MVRLVAPDEPVLVSPHPVAPGEQVVELEPGEPEPAGEVGGREEGGAPVEAGLPGPEPHEGGVGVRPADEPVGGGHGHQQEQQGGHTRPAGRLQEGGPGEAPPPLPPPQHLPLPPHPVGAGQHPAVPRRQLPAPGQEGHSLGGGWSGGGRVMAG